jgi:methionyl-tRNA formyltransferase
MNHKDLKIIFMGTPQIAATILSGLLTEGYKISAVVTRPDKAQGRSKEPQKSPVKELAEKNNVSVFQPNTKLELEGYISTQKPDLIVVCAFGMIITKKTLETAKYGAINVHPSLLPKYRGPWPIGAPILNGDRITGTTIMVMSEGMDEGDILSQEEIRLNGTETTPELTERLAIISSALLLKTIPKLIEGIIKPKKQNTKEASYTKMEKKEDGKIDWNKEATEIERQSRAYTPWPGTYTSLDGKKLDLFDIFVKEIEIPKGVVKEIDGEILIGTQKGAISPAFVKIEGKSKIAVSDFARGHQSFIGATLGEKVSKQK